MTILKQAANWPHGHYSRARLNRVRVRHAAWRASKRHDIVGGAVGPSLPNFGRCHGQYRLHGPAPLVPVHSEFVVQEPVAGGVGAPAHLPIL